MFTNKFCFLLLMSVLLVCINISKAVVFHTFDMGFDYNGRQPLDATPDNQKIVGSQQTLDGIQAAVWKFNGSEYVEQTLSGSSYAYAISDDGSTIAGGGPIVWTQTGETYDNITQLSENGYGFDLSSDGSIVVGTTSLDKAAVWIDSGSGYNETILDAIGTISSGYRTSADGSVIVGKDNSNCAVWKNDGSGYGAPTSLDNITAMNISDDGTVIVGNSDYFFPEGQAAICIDDGSGFGSPIILESDYISSVAFAISQDKKVIGGKAWDSPSYAAIWKYNELTETWDYYNLVDLLSAQGIDVSNWTLETVDDVNYDSETGTYSFIGTGVDSDFDFYQMGYVVEGFSFVPEPATICLLVLGGIIISRKRKPASLNS